MARVAVVGGGYAGLATAARLAKIGHDVTVLEAADRVGGAVGHVERDGFRWDAGPAHTLLPAVLRDLFRKSGRPLERELELVPVQPGRRHVFDDETTLDLPVGSRGDQMAAWEELGEGLGATWSAYVDTFADDWEALRRDYFERPFSPEHAGKHARALLGTRMTLHKLLQRSFKDPRQREVAGLEPAMEGHDLRNVPAWVGLWTYVEQNFGLWTSPGGMGALAGALEARLRTRGVTVLTGTPVRDVVVREGRAVGVLTDDGPLDADVVVVAVDPRRLPTMAPHVARTTPVVPPVVSHLGLVGAVPDLPHETVLHGDPLVVVRTGGQAPDGAHAWTVLARGKIAEDVVSVLQRAGIRVRDQVQVRVDRSPLDLVREWNGSPQGVLWQGRATVTRRLGPRTPVPGVLAAGAHAAPGAGLPSVGLSAALVAQVLGPA